MTKLRIFAVGSILLLAMEAGFSLALRRYDLPGQRTPFLRGPLTMALSGLMQDRAESTPRAKPVQLGMKPASGVRQSPGVDAGHPPAKSGRF